MDGQAGTPADYGILLHVIKIAKIKVFYRDIVGLGAPIIETNFWVQFRLPRNGMLILEKCDNVIPNVDRHEISWLLPVQDFEEFLDLLQHREVPRTHPSTQIPGVRCETFADPEGNPFTIYEHPQGAKVAQNKTGNSG